MFYFDGYDFEIEQFDSFKTNESVKVILYWSDWDDSLWKKPKTEYEALNTCEYKCIHTSNKALLKSSDLIVFRVRNIFLNEMPKLRHPNQIWLLGEMESPLNIWIKRSRYGFFRIKKG